ncbi:MAG TPA: polyphosphate kinase 1, partial [Acidobacteriota bacterium]
SELDWEEEVSTDLLNVIETELRKRRHNPVVRFEVEQRISESFLQMFLEYLEGQQLELHKNRLFLDPRFLMNVADLPAFDSLRLSPLLPHTPVELQGNENLWSLLREQDIVLHHPYESFEPIVQLISQAADDPDVLAIKQTLYRTSPNSPIIRALARAGLNGKQVAVLVELTARFDEERNIGWARQLEKSGVHVIYGLAGLKTHAKILLIVRRESDGIRRYVHLGTGNYNERTARVYTDISLLTSEDAIGRDASGFFNTITGYSDPPEFEKLVMSPTRMRQKVLSLIRRETERAGSGQLAIIWVKMNSLVDPQVTQALYAASQAGVSIRLAVRGICCLRPGVKGVSDRITVVSIVDRFLEHSRIFYFLNGGEEEFYCSSADWMPRNLDRRVELLFPVRSEKGREKLRKTFELFFTDNCKARVLQPDGSYVYKKRKKNEELVRFQDVLYQSITREHESHRTVTFKPQTVPPEN